MLPTQRFFLAHPNLFLKTICLFWPCWVLAAAHGGLPSLFWPVESLVAASELLVVGTWNLVP